MLRWTDPRQPRGFRFRGCPFLPAAGIPTGWEGAPARGSRGDPLSRLEPPLFGLFLACWLAVVLHSVGVVSLAGVLALSFYELYAVAAVLGWVSGNVYVHKRRRLPREHRRRAAVLWLVGPQGIPALLRAMAPPGAEVTAPLVPLYAFGVGAVFFCVPLVFGRR